MSTSSVLPTQSDLQKGAESDRPLADEGLFFLSDEQWDAVSIVLPVRQRGPKRSDDRLIISGILHVLQSGCAWRDCPSRYGPYMTVFNRYLRWRQRGLWHTILDRLPKSAGLPRLAQRARAEYESTTKRRAQDNVSSRVRLSVARDAARDQLDVMAKTVGVPRIDGRVAAFADVDAILRGNTGQSHETIVQSIIEWHTRREAETISILDPLLGWKELEEPAITHRDGAFDHRLRALITVFRRDCVLARSRLVSALECLQLCLRGEVDAASGERLMLDALLGGKSESASADSVETDAHPANERKVA